MEDAKLHTVRRRVIKNLQILGALGVKTRKQRHGTGEMRHRGSGMEGLKGLCVERALV